MSLDRKPIDLCRKVPHGVLCNAHRNASFGLNVLLYCLCGHSNETLQHLFLYCPLAESCLDWIHSLLVRSSGLWHQLLLNVGFSSDELLCFPGVFCYLLSL